MSRILLNAAVAGVLASILIASGASAQQSVADFYKGKSVDLFIGYAPVIDPKYAIVSIIEHGAVQAHPHVAMARDVMLLCQQRDPSRMPALWPVTNSASAASPRVQGAAQTISPQSVKAGG